MPFLYRALFAAILTMQGLAAGAAQREVLLVPIEGTIGVATGEWVVDAIGQAREQDAEALILQMDTPGGLDSAMRTIIKGILASPVPVVAWVAPSGSRAASAGTYILYASHVAAMAPATNLGAATPVRIGGLPRTGDTPESPDDSTEKPQQEQPDDPMKAKLINDAVAYIRGLATLRGRNAEWAERAVRESVSLASGEALEQRVIDLIADDANSLLQQIDGHSVRLPTGERMLDTAGLPLRRLEPDWRVRLLSVITDPNVAYLLLMVGIYGLIFELSNPGAMLPGVIGVISLLLGLYALQVLPVNYAGLALMLLGIALMAGEAFAPSFGVLGLGGLAAFVFGSIILLDEQGLRISLPVIGATGLFTGGLSVWVLGRLLKLRRKAVVSGTQRLIGLTAVALEDFQNTGRVRVEGEVWQARTSRPVQRDRRLRVTGVQGLYLNVEPEQQE